MKKNFAFLAALLASFVVAPCVVQAQSLPSSDVSQKVEAPSLRGDKVGLLLAFHGAPSPNWSKLTDALVEKVRVLNDERPTFAAVEGGQLEYTPDNDLVVAFQRLENAGCDFVVVLPAFVYPTSHVQFDVPSVLGLYSSPEMREALAEEETRVLQTSTPTVVAPTFSSGDLLKDFVFSEAKSISSSPSQERLLVIAHGDEEYAGLVDRLTQPALDACSALGFDRVESAFCEMGQTFGEKVKPIVEKNTAEGKKTLIVAVYLASSAEKFVERVQKFPIMDGAENPDANSLEGLDYVTSKGSLGEFEETPRWIFETARDAALAP